MEEVGFAILLALVGLGGAFTKWRFNYRRDAKRKRLARWAAGYESKGGETRILVQRVFTDSKEVERVLDSVVFATITEADADWETKFHQGMSEAHSNAAARNSERVALKG